MKDDVVTKPKKKKRRTRPKEDLEWWQAKQHEIIWYFGRLVGGPERWYQDVQDDDDSITVNKRWLRGLWQIAEKAPYARTGPRRLVRRVYRHESRAEQKKVRAEQERVRAEKQKENERVFAPLRAKYFEMLVIRSGHKSGPQALKKDKAMEYCAKEAARILGVRSWKSVLRMEARFASLHDRLNRKCRKWIARGWSTWRATARATKLAIRVVKRLANIDLDEAMVWRHFAQKAKKASS
jgi:hypothetical protein